MSKMTSEKLLDLLYNKKLPPIYRIEDFGQKLQLKRYLMAIFKGGFEEVIEEAASITELVDPLKCPEKFLPYFIESFGIAWQEDIPSSYQRYLAANIGELLRRRGTYSGVRFLVRVLTGQECELEYFRGEIEGEYGRFLNITLLCDTIEDVWNQEIHVKVISRYIGMFVPFYIFPIRIKAVVRTQNLETDIYRGALISGVSLNYDLRGYKNAKIYVGVCLQLMCKKIYQEVEINGLG